MNLCCYVPDAKLSGETAWGWLPPDATYPLNHILYNMYPEFELNLARCIKGKDLPGLQSSSIAYPPSQK